MFINVTVLWEQNMFDFILIYAYMHA